MTVAAVILSATAEGAVADADGVPRVRRMADAAWAGGAIPVVVVAPDPDGAVAEALAGSEAALVEPADPALGPAGQIARGIRAAIAAIRETDAALVWPARLCWVDAETLTSLIEAHGVDRRPVLRPSWRGDRGWPALVPVEALASIDAVAAERMPDEVLDDLAAGGWPVEVLDLGDPGCVLDAGTPRAELPPYEGPQEPASGHHHEWGASVGGAAGGAPGPASLSRRRARRPNGGRPRPSYSPPIDGAVSALLPAIAARTRPTGAVAKSRPPRMSAHAEHLERRRRLSEEDPGGHDRHDRLHEQEQRRQRGGQARERDADQPVAGDLRREGDGEEPEQGLGAGRQVEAARRDADDEPGGGADDGGVQERPEDAAAGAPPPDEQQVGGVGGRREQPEQDAERGIGTVGAVLQDPGDAYGARDRRQGSRRGAVPTGARRAAAIRRGRR